MAEVVKFPQPFCVIRKHRPLLKEALIRQPQQMMILGLDGEGEIFSVDNYKNIHQLLDHTKDYLELLEKGIREGILS